jgi:hypothetical protein
MGDQCHTLRSESFCRLDLIGAGVSQDHLADGFAGGLFDHPENFRKVIGMPRVDHEDRVFKLYPADVRGSEVPGRAQDAHTGRELLRLESRPGKQRVRGRPQGDEYQEPAQEVVAGRIQ